MLDEAVVKVLSSQVGVSGGGLDLKHALIDGENRDIEGSTTQIEDEDVLLASCALLVQPCTSCRAQSDCLPPSKLIP